MQHNTTRRSLNPEGNTWGGEVGDEVDAEIKALLGIDEQLTKPGKTAEETQAKREAIRLINAPQRNGENARQTMQNDPKAIQNRIENDPQIF